MRVVVLGGGFIGQLVQLAIPSARVLEVRKKPSSHLDTRVGPQYLWEPISGCESKSFPVITTVDGAVPTPESILAYKRKIGKENDGGDWAKQFQHEMIGWDSTLPVPRIEYETSVAMIDLESKALVLTNWENIEYDYLVSTIPMDKFLALMIVGPVVRYPWRQDPIWMRHMIEPLAKPVEGMHLNYLSHPDVPWYRDTRTGTRVFSESLSEHEEAKRIYPGKIHPHPEIEIVTAGLSQYNVFCFGRFAAWRPDELAHETWKEILTWKEFQGL